MVGNKKEMWRARFGGQDVCKLYFSSFRFYTLKDNLCMKYVPYDTYSVFLLCMLYVSKYVSNPVCVAVLCVSGYVCVHMCISRHS
jgi:hypothetical protein